MLSKPDVGKVRGSDLGRQLGGQILEATEPKLRKQGIIQASETGKEGRRAEEKEVGFIKR